MMDERTFGPAPNRSLSRSGMQFASLKPKAGGATFPVFILLLWYVFGRGFRARFFVTSHCRAASL
jgi:hypothetical protein